MTSWPRWRNQTVREARSRHARLPAIAGEAGGDDARGSCAGLDQAKRTRALIVRYAPRIRAV